MVNPQKHLMTDVFRKTHSEMCWLQIIKVQTTGGAHYQFWLLCWSNAANAYIVELALAQKPTVCVKNLSCIMKVYY